MGGGCGRVAGDTFTAGDVHSLPAGVQQAMVACAELSRELHRHCSRADSGVGGAGGGGVDCHVSPDAGQSISRAWTDEEDDEEEDEEERDEDVEVLDWHAKQLWSLYCTVREAGC